MLFNLWRTFKEGSIFKGEDIEVLFANQIHQLSPFFLKKMFIVDCGSLYLVTYTLVHFYTFAPDTGGVVPYQESIVFVPKHHCLFKIKLMNQ